MKRRCGFSRSATASDRIEGLQRLKELARDARLASHHRFDAARAHLLEPQKISSGRQSSRSGPQQLAIYALIAGVVLFAISPLVRRLMGEIK